MAEVQTPLHHAIFDPNLTQFEKIKALGYLDPDQYHLLNALLYELQTLKQMKLEEMSRAKPVDQGIQTEDYV